MDRSLDRCRQRCFEDRHDVGACGSRPSAGGAESIQGAAASGSHGLLGHALANDGLSDANLQAELIAHWTLQTLKAAAPTKLRLRPDDVCDVIRRCSRWARDGESLPARQQGSQDDCSLRDTIARISARLSRTSRSAVFQRTRLRHRGRRPTGLRHAGRDDRYPKQTYTEVVTQLSPQEAVVNLTVSGTDASVFVT